MLSKLMDSLSSILPSEFRLKAQSINVLVRILSIFLIILIYQMFRKVIPGSIVYSLEISMLSAMLIAVIGILPLQEFLDAKLKKLFLSEFLFDDPLTLKSARRKFEYDTLISNVFPDMVNISGSNSGRIALLDKRGSSFNIYTYTRGGKQKKVKKKNYQISESLILFLKENKQGISIDKCIQNPKYNEYFITFKANYILPFLFRDKLFGFLAVTNIPLEQDLMNLMVLGSKCAMAIYNHNLSSQIAIHAKYKREFEVASKIEDLIFTKKMQDFKTYQFNSPIKNPNILIEFLSGVNEQYFVLLTLGINRIGSGLVSSYLLGTLYSQGFLKKKRNVDSIKRLIDQTMIALSWQESYELLIGRFLYDKPGMSLYHYGLNFKVTDPEDPNTNLLSVGWRNQHENLANNNFNIYYKNNIVLEIIKKV
ncbi:MAG: hypothetical protein H7A25_00515 [Leptospiraceae bacterium]|nr:hypothetical protein [Leptospiraceae bacterium]MCP5498359.1 hypothetical protein [Leptospiraceae bacterium]